jgi:hypothetical protein
MRRDFFDPTSEQHNVTLIETVTLRDAERLIESCEACNSESAQIPFDYILDQVTGSDPSVTDYILQEPAKCPHCRREVLEKTLIEPGAREAAHLYFEPIFSGLRFVRERLASLREKRRERLRARRLARELLRWEWELAEVLKRKLERVRALGPEQVREQQVAQVWDLAQELQRVQKRVLDLEPGPEQVWERELVRECLRELGRFVPRSGYGS